MVPREKLREVMRPGRDTEKETEKEEESDHRNHKHIERKIYGPSTPVKFLDLGMKFYF